MVKKRIPPRQASQRRRTPALPTRRRFPSPTGAAFASTLLAQAVDLVHVIDATGTIRYISPAITRLLGYQVKEVQGHESFHFVHPDDVPLLRKATADILRQPGRSTRREYRVRHKDGSWRLFEGVATNLLEDPTVAGVVINSRDITERAQTLVSLQESETRYRQLAELSPNPVFVHVDGKLVYVNAAAITFFGAQSAEELIGALVQGLILPTSHALQQQRIHQILHEGRAAQFLQFPFLRRDGRTVQAEAAGTAITYGGTPAVQTVLRELTVPPRDDQALRASEERYRLLFDNANDAIAAFTIEGIVTDVNQGAQALLGWTPEELLGQHYHKVLTPAAQGLAEERTRQYLAGADMSSIFEIDLLHKDGRVIPVEARTRPIRDRQGTVIGFQGSYRDIRERKQAEQHLRESQQLQERIADTLPAMLYLYDYATGQVLYCNRRVTTILGYAPQEVMSQTVAQLRVLVHEEDREHFTTWDRQFAAASDDDAFEAEYRVKHLNGEYRWLHVRERVCTRTATGAPARILGMAEDNTARKQIRARMQRRRIRREEIPKRLRTFRERLGATQAEFGLRFGNFRAYQIGSYETGVADLPLDLLLAIQDQGYPLSAILGDHPDALLDETLTYLSSRYSQQVVAERLAETQRELAVRARMKPEGKALFISERRTALSRQMAWVIIRDYGLAAGLAVASHPHMLRHACGYALADQGADTRLIQDYLGHRNIQHTVQYTATNPARFERLWR